METINNIVFDLSGNDFLLPYLRRELAAAEADQSVAAIKIVTNEREGAFSADFDEYCAANGLPVAVLHCPYIVGTGMTGLPHRIAAGIYKGLFVHIRGNEARISVVHATDVARAAALAAGVQGTYTLTDCCDPTVAELADAIATRMNDKRIYTLPPRWAKLWYGKSYFEILTSDHTLPCTFCEVFPDFHPSPVTEYLRTHVYDESSL